MSVVLILLMRCVTSAAHELPVAGKLNLEKHKAARFVTMCKGTKICTTPRKGKQLSVERHQEQ